MRFLLLLSPLFVLLLAGCESAGKSVTASGHEYTLHLDKQEGETAKAGEYAYFHLRLYTQDSTLINTRDGAEPTLARIHPDSLDTKVGPVESMLKLMSVGDSATVSFFIDTIPNRGPYLDTVKYLYYDLAVTEILDEAGFNARRAEEQAEQLEAMKLVQARAEEVATFAEQTLADYKADKLELQETPSGLKYIIHEAGDGQQAVPNRVVTVQYYGLTVEGEENFDGSFTGGRGYPFPLGQGRVIPGWDEGIALLTEGTKATLFIPANLAYGPNGSGEVIPPNAQLMFYVELEDVR